MDKALLGNNILKMALPLLADEIIESPRVRALIEGYAQMGADVDRELAEAEQWLDERYAEYKTKVYDARARVRNHTEAFITGLRDALNENGLATIVDAVDEARANAATVE